MLESLVITSFLMAFCMVANRLTQSVLTAPMIFLGFGYFISQIGVLPHIITEETLHLVAEIALVILLFLDAAQIDQRSLMTRSTWPRRMLLVGMPLAFVFGTLSGTILWPELSLAATALIAAILMPTDAALGQPVVTNKAVAERTRRALTVESGLNDGLALPVVLLMASFAAPVANAPAEGWAIFTLKQITLGPLAGLIVGLIGAYVLLWAKRTHSTAEIYEGIGALALAATAFLMASAVGGNGLISAFFAGLGFGAVVQGRCAFVLEFTEGDGQLLSWSAFFLLGALMVPEAIAHLSPEMLAVILVSLFVVRPAAIWLSLLGTDASAETRLFFGWFGPRGLATALFALFVIEQLDHGLGETVLHTAVNAVWISALLHGLTAAFGAQLYAKRMGDSAKEAGIDQNET